MHVELILTTCSSRLQDEKLSASRLTSMVDGHLTSMVDGQCFGVSRVA
jgi:hypothetical protein